MKGEKTINASKWVSRKFLVSLITQLAALAVLFYPSQESEIMHASQSIASLCVLLLSSLGYIKVEGNLDNSKMKIHQS